MDAIAFFLGDAPIYMNSVVLALSAAAAVCFFLADRLREPGRGDECSIAVPMSILLSLLLARLLHWYFRADSYTGPAEAMLDLTHGGFALLGVFLGCTLTAVFLRVTSVSRDLPGMLDSLSVAAAGGIALGRLACFFSPSDRGVTTALTGLPFAWPVTNNVTGRSEYRLAVFLFQAAACAVIFLILVCYRLRKKRPGNTAVLFLLLYGMSQTILDSMRYDSLFFRSNGFIGVSQLLGAVSMVFVCVFVSVRLCRAGGFRRSLLAVWLAMAAMMGTAGYMEYYVQRHSSETVFSYSIMTAALSVMTILALCLFVRGNRLAAAAETEE